MSRRREQQANESPVNQHTAPKRWRRRRGLFLAAVALMALTVAGCVDDLEAERPEDERAAQAQAVLDAMLLTNGALVDKSEVAGSGAFRPAALQDQGTQTTVVASGPRIASLLGDWQPQLGAPFTLTVQPAPTGNGETFTDLSQVSGVAVGIYEVSGALLRSTTVAERAGDDSITLEIEVLDQPDLPTDISLSMEVMLIGVDGEVGPAVPHDIRLGGLAPDTAQGVMSLAAEVEGITALAFAPDDNLLVVGGASGLVELWDSQRGVRLSSFVGQTGRVYDVGVCEGSDYVKSSGANGVTIWSRQADTIVYTNNEHDGLVSGVAVVNNVGPTAEDVVMATVGWDGTVRTRRYDAAAIAEASRIMSIGGDMSDAVQPAAVVMSATQRLNDVALSPDGELVAAGGGRITHFGTLQVWDADDGTEVFRSQELGAEITSVGFSPDGTLVLAGTGRGAIGVWSLDDGSQVAELTAGGDSIAAFGFPNGTSQLVGSTLSGFVNLWDLEDAEVGASIMEGRLRDAASAMAVSSGQVAFGSPDGVVRVTAMPEL